MVTLIGVKEVAGIPMMTSCSVVTLTGVKGVVGIPMMTSCSVVTLTGVKDVAGSPIITSCSVVTLIGAAFAGVVKIGKKTNPRRTKSVLNHLPKSSPLPSLY